MRMQIWRSLAGAGVLLVVCSQNGRAQTKPGGLEETSVPVVENVGPPIWARGGAWTVREELRIGPGAGAEYEFGSIGGRGIAVTSDGRIHVLDALAREIRVFGPEGRYKRTVGGAGAGPGEIGPGTQFLLAGSGDTLFLPDLQNARVNRYAPDGSPAASVRLNLDRGVPLMFEAGPSGEIIAQVRQLAETGMPSARPHDALVRFGGARPVGDTLATFPAGATIGEEGGLPALNIFAVETAWTVLADGRLALGENSQMAVRLLDRNGKPYRVVTRGVDAHPVDEPTGQAVRRYFRALWVDQGLPPDVVSALVDRIHVGERYPAFTGLMGGPEGTLWVQRPRILSEMSDDERESFDFVEDLGSPVWDVYDAGGRWLGPITFPRRFALRLIRGDRAYGVWRDELDVQSVLRFAIVKPAR